MFALAALYLFDDPRQFRQFMTMIPHLPEVFTGERPHLLAQPQNGWVNEPLPLGVMVEHGSDGATVTIEGLPDGADLSLGSADRFGWSVVAADLEQTYVGPPANFVGVIGPTATLRSASGTLLDRQPLHFEWRASKSKPSDKPPVETINYETAPAAATTLIPSAPSPPPKSAFGPRRWRRRRILLGVPRAARLLLRNEARGHRTPTGNGRAAWITLTRDQR
jgi:hypothetical protein